ncbi:MAG: LytTR family DNA-binding domain-containing protein, partial [Bacteroidota bacterium]
MTHSNRISWSSRFLIDKSFIFVLVLIALGLFQDIWHAYVKNYPFYWYESLLFKSYWLCFLPFIWKITCWEIPNKKILIAAKIFIISILQILLATIFIYLIAALFFYEPFRWQNIFNYLFKQHFIATLLIYGATFVFTNFKNRKAEAKREKSIVEFITVSKDKENLPIKVEEILFVQTNRPYIAIHTARNRFLKSATLKQFLAIINHPNFLQIHKSTIINILHVKSYVSRQNGDYDLIMKNGNMIRLSRNYAKILKEKMTAAP